MEKYNIGDVIKTKFGDLPIVGFLDFKHFGTDKEEYMTLPYLEHNGKKYIFSDKDGTNGNHLLIEVNE